MLANISQAVITSVICLIISTVVAVIGYFLKRTMSRVDKFEDDIAEISSEYESAEEHEKDIIDIKEELKDIKGDLKGFSNEFLKRDEFIRSIAEINHKFDRIEDKIDTNARETGSKLDKLLAGLNKEG